MARPESLEKAMDYVNEGTTIDQREKESINNPMPREIREPDIDPPSPALPPPELKSQLDVNPAPRISSLYPAVKLKGYRRR